MLVVNRAEWEAEHPEYGVCNVRTHGQMDYLLEGAKCLFDDGSDMVVALPMGLTFVSRMPVLGGAWFGQNKRWTDPL